MKALATSIEIDAPPERVWEVLTDFASYAAWNPFIIRAIGDLSPGTEMEVTVRPPGRRGTTLYRKVLKVVPNREIRWLDRLFLPGLYDREHALVLDRLESDRTRLTQREVFRGLFVLLVGPRLRDTQRGFEEMNRALKERVEGG